MFTTQDQIDDIIKTFTISFFKANLSADGTLLLTPSYLNGQFNIDWSSKRYPTPQRLFEVFSNYSVSFIWSGIRTKIIDTRQLGNGIVVSLQPESRLVLFTHKNLKIMNKKLYISITGARDTGSNFYTYESWGIDDFN